MRLRPIGEYLVEEGIITEAQLEAALLRQKEYRSMRLGEILIQMKALSRLQLDEVVSHQMGLLQDETSRPQRRRIGELMIEKGFISQEQLEQALQRQVEFSRMRLGEILLELGHLEEFQLETAITRQLEVLNSGGSSFAQLS